MFSQPVAHIIIDFGLNTLNFHLKFSIIQFNS